VDQDFCLHCIVIVLQLKFTEEELDEGPLIEASTYYCGTGPDFADLYYLKILLLDKNKNALTKFHTGENKILVSRF
jgi:hypothetical protein